MVFPETSSFLYLKFRMARVQPGVSKPVSITSPAASSRLQGVGLRAAKDHPEDAIL